MKAVVVERYGPPEVAVVAEEPLPEPGLGEVLVRVDAAAVTSGDARMRAASFPPGFGFLARLGIGIRGPRRRVLGVAFSGRVERASSDVAEFSPGDEVAGMTGARLGAHAEYVVVPSSRLAPKPRSVSPEDAAGILFGGSTALWFLRDRAHVRPGDRVLVNGASGSVGSAAVQLARHFGASVTAVTSAANTQLVLGLGAERAIDYRETPVAAIPDRFDVVFDAVGNLSRAEGLPLLAPGGRLILAVAGLADTAIPHRGVITGTAPERAEDFELLLGLLASGGLRATTRALDGLESVAAAYRLIDSGRKVGNLVVRPRLTGHAGAGSWG